MSFEAWMLEVDQLCFAWYGISIHDLPDMNFRDAYDEDTEPEAFLLSVAGSEENLRNLIFS